MLEKSTQTYSCPKYPPPGKQVKFTVEAETQTDFCTHKIPGAQTSLRNHAENIHHACTTNDLPKTCSSDTVTLSFRACSCDEVCKETQPNFPSEAPTTMSVGLQTIMQKNCFSTSHIALQTNLPTEENLKYINDLQMQKKVNMAIAELCFHLSKSKETEEV